MARFADAGNDNATLGVQYQAHRCIELVVQVVGKFKQRRSFLAYDRPSARKRIGTKIPIGRELPKALAAELSTLVPIW